MCGACAALSAAVLQGEAAAVPDAEHGLGCADPAGHPRRHLRVRVSGRPAPRRWRPPLGGRRGAGCGSGRACRWRGPRPCLRLPSARPRPRSALGSSRLSGRAPGRMGLPCHRPPGAAATQRDTGAPRSHRYVGELISDSEADVREEDSYLFDLDNKVRCPRGRASAQSQPPFCGVLSREPELRPLSLCGACVTQAPRGPEARGPRAEWRPAAAWPWDARPCPWEHGRGAGGEARALSSVAAAACRPRSPCGQGEPRPRPLLRGLCVGHEPSARDSWPDLAQGAPESPRAARSGPAPCVPAIFRGGGVRASRPSAVLGPRAAPSSRGGVRAQRRSRRSWSGVRRPSAPLGVCDVLRAVSDTRRPLGRGHTPPPRSLRSSRADRCLSPARGSAAAAPAPTVPSAGPSRGPCASRSFVVSRSES